VHVLGQVAITRAFFPVAHGTILAVFLFCPMRGKWAMTLLDFLSLGRRNWSWFRQPALRQQRALASAADFASVGGLFFGWLCWFLGLTV